VDSPTHLAASQLQEIKSRIVQAKVKETFEKTLGDNISLINAPKNARSLMLMNQLLSHGKGWDFMSDAKQIDLPNGETGWTFVLNHDSRLNQIRFEEAYGRPLVKGQEALNPDGNMMVLDELAFDTFKRMQAFEAIDLAAANTVL
jgi:hypothetical protein